MTLENLKRINEGYNDVTIDDVAIAGLPKNGPIPGTVIVTKENEQGASTEASNGVEQGPAVHPVTGEAHVIRAAVLTLGGGSTDTERLEQAALGAKMHMRLGKAVPTYRKNMFHVSWACTRVCGLSKVRTVLFYAHTNLCHVLGCLTVLQWGLQHLFPFGRGHPGDPEQQTPISLVAYVRHCLKLSHRRFDDNLFINTAADVLNKCKFKSLRVPLYDAFNRMGLLLLEFGHPLNLRTCSCTCSLY